MKPRVVKERHIRMTVGAGHKCRLCDTLFEEGEVGLAIIIDYWKIPTYSRFSALCTKCTNLINEGLIELWPSNTEPS